MATFSSKLHQADKITLMFLENKTVSETSTIIFLSEWIMFESYLSITYLDKLVKISRVNVIFIFNFWLYGLKVSF